VSIRTGHVSNIFPKARISRESKISALINAEMEKKKQVDWRRAQATGKNAASGHPVKGARRSEMLRGLN